MPVDLNNARTVNSCYFHDRARNVDITISENERRYRNPINDVSKDNSRERAIQVNPLKKRHQAKQDGLIGAQGAK